MYEQSSVTVFNLNFAGAVVISCNASEPSKICCVFEVT